MNYYSGILAIEAALLASVTAHSVDLDPAACDAARANAAAAAPRLRGRVTVHCGDAARGGGEGQCRLHGPSRGDAPLGGGLGAAGGRGGPPSRERGLRARRPAVRDSS